MNSIAIISDIHGNYPALQAALNDIDSKGIKKIYCLGDLVGYYCMINEVVDEIRRRNIKTIIGNHDYALIKNGGIITTSKTCTNILQRQITYISPANLSFLNTLTDTLEFNFNNLDYYCVHGGLKNHVEEYIQNINEQYFVENNFSKNVLVSGHTHLPVIKNFTKADYLNPGSVGQPRDGDKRSAYLLLQDSAPPEIVRVAYNIDAIVQKMKEMNFEDYISEVLYRGVKIGG